VIDVDARSGRRLSASCRGDPERSRREIARWPSLATPWLPASERKASAIPPLSADCAPDALAGLENLRIDGPAEGSLLAPPPGSNRPPTLRLRALGTASRVQWLVNGRLAGETRGQGSWTVSFEQAGPQHVTALADTGAWAELRLRVLD
jgi:penicillin-binding protein 1C